jgi:eukaryotic-like serine/threonine-protein kinase
MVLVGSSRYTVAERIGLGAMGEVYRAHDRVLNRPVAIKTISPHAFATWDDSLVERFRREAQAAASLNHPNIITIYDFGEEDGVLYIAMELLEGTDLLALLERGPRLGLDEALDLLEQVADGIAFAHSRGIVHRDLKPANVHLLPTGRVKIMDFGLARSRESKMTQIGWALGTPHYMAPEQVRGEPADARTDVFCLGVLAYEVLTGKRPFPAESLQAVLFQVLEREPEPMRSFAPEIPPILEAVVRRALAKDPRERFQDGTELRAALREVRGALSGGSAGSAALPGAGTRAVERGPRGRRGGAAEVDRTLALLPRTPSGHREQAADEVRLVQASFALVVPRRAAAAELFYRLLFEIDPGVRPLFAATDMRVQGEMLLTVLSSVVQGLDSFAELRPTLVALGRRHRSYGVELKHYDAVEQALLEMLQRLLGDAFTPEVRRAWSRVYNQIARVMIEA